jgi:hypothetical protein
VITNAIPATKVRLLGGGGFAVVSDWDETVPGFEEERLLRNPEQGMAPLTARLNEDFFLRSQSVVARVVAGETLLVPIRAKVGDLASILQVQWDGVADLEIAGVAANGGATGGRGCPGI